MACLVLWAAALQGQQTPAPVVPLETPATAPADAPDALPKEVVIDPKTGLPMTPEAPDVTRDKEIKRYDPMDRTADLTGQTLHPLTDRQAPADATDKNGDDPLTGADPTTAKNGQDATARGNGGSGSGSGLTGPAYTGPAVLSRSYTLSRPMISRQIKWTVGLGFARSLDIGQTQAVPNPDGTVPSSVQSNMFSWSVSGRHLFKRSQVGLAYQGNSSSYSSNQNLSGTNHSLNMDFAHLFTRRLSVQFVESLSLLSQNYSLENPTLAPGSSIANINLATSPEIQVLDNTVRQSASTASLTFQKSARLSYSVSTSYFFIARAGTGLTGMMGRQASVDTNYRWTQKATVGAYYSYTNYRYSHDISESNSQGGGFIFSYALSRSLQVRTRFGATRIETLGYATVLLPPSLASILGQSATVVDAYSSRRVSEISVELVRDFRRGRSLSLSYARGMSPGNGLLLTSVQETLSAGYSANLRKRLPVNAGIMYSNLQATGQSDLGFYKSETVFLGSNHVMKYGISTNINLSYRRFDISGSPLLQHDTRITIGVTWTPTENMLRF